MQHQDAAEPTPVPPRQIRAAFTERTVTVYQAYPPVIGEHAARHGAFPASWSRSRMTWIKPSFRWMMYRSGWGTKPGQEVVLALEISRAGFESALAGAVLSHYDAAVHTDREAWTERLRQSTVRVQWDPERDLDLNALPHRSLQLGLAGRATRDYADHWLGSVRDVTPLAHRVRELVRAGDRTAAAALLPAEAPYPPLPEAVARELRASPPT
ncbi:DUF4291 domain-containing protein [Kitasatospora sp. NBC_01287]|uniref:DUF4291 domain-containing protein n=1 Tax=Kitasatospora sp. NBC_01287 TaxID=2903573 RepID=UPI002254A608|nr:DUF4291 domain-containing protein [Kitasatospora sp. NBC_01287]MCX4746328.1 DUF4291 domain-containing protein [Kitasatospora sp. NBC_01287]